MIFSIHRPYPVFFQLAAQLGLQLQDQGLLEVDRPDRVILGDPGVLDFTSGHGEVDRLLQEVELHFRNLLPRFRDSKLAPVIGSLDIVVRPLKPLLDLGVGRVPDEQGELVRMDLKVDAAVDRLKGKSLDQIQKIIIGSTSVPLASAR